VDSVWVRVGLGYGYRHSALSATELTNPYIVLHPSFTATTSPSNADFPSTSSHPSVLLYRSTAQPGFPGVNGSHR